MQRIFAADIGGTNARFARFTENNGELALESVVWTRSTELAATADLLEAMQQHLHARFARGDALAVALAGPVSDMRGKLTNGELRVDLRKAPGQYGLASCLLLNDFMAEAWSTLTCCGQEASLVHGKSLGQEHAWATRAVLGAGTGLGAASLVWFGGAGATVGWRPLPSEAGHGPFAFVGHEEHEYQDFLSRELGHDLITAENVLSGEGLSLLHYFLTGQYYHAPSVGEAALAHESPTLDWYGRFLGRFCRQWICSTLCHGGLWISGGIAARNPLCVAAKSFARELECASALTDLTGTVPVRLVDNTNSGLWGAARAAQEGLKTAQGLERL